MSTARPTGRAPRGEGGPGRAVLIVAAILVVLVGILIYLFARPNTLSDGDTATPGLSPTPTAAATTPAAATAPPSPTPTPAASPTPTPEDSVVLSAAGIGDVAIGTPDAQAALEAMFGPPGRQEPGNTECGGPDDMTYVWWGDLKVSFTGGALYGWGLRSTTVPDGVVTASGIAVGDPYADVVALPGAAPEYQEAYGRVITNVDGVHYWSSEGSDPAAVTVFDIEVNPVVCG